VDFGSLTEHSLSLCTFYPSLGEDRETRLPRAAGSSALFHPLGSGRRIWAAPAPGQLRDRRKAAARGSFLEDASNFKTNNFSLLPLDLV